MVETTMSNENEQDKDAQEQASSTEKSYSATGTSFTAQPQEQQQEDLGLAVTQEDYDDVLEIEKGPVEKVNLSGLVIDMQNQIKHITRMTYADRVIFVRAYLAAGYLLGITSPEKQICKKIDRLEAHGQVLENQIERYQKDIDKAGSEFLVAQESMHKAVKVREDIKMKMTDLESELAKETQDTDKSRAVYPSATAEQKAQLKQMINAYLESKYKKTAALDAEKNKLRRASRSFTRGYYEVGRIESRRMKYESIVQSLYKLESQNLWLIEQYKDVLENKDASSLDVLKQMTKIAKDVQNLAKSEQEFSKHINAMNDNIDKLPDAIYGLTNMGVRDKERCERNEKRNAMADDEVLRADRLYESMYMPRKKKDNTSASSQTAA